MIKHMFNAKKKYTSTLLLCCCIFAAIPQYSMAGYNTREKILLGCTILFGATTFVLYRLACTQMQDLAKQKARLSTSEPLLNQYRTATQSLVMATKQALRVSDEYHIQYLNKACEPLNFAHTLQTTLIEQKQIAPDATWPQTLQFMMQISSNEQHKTFADHCVPLMQQCTIYTTDSGKISSILFPPSSALYPQAFVDPSAPSTNYI
jgi:hypothetical protein